jgi:hypothetical protein
MLGPRFERPSKANVGALAEALASLGDQGAILGSISILSSSFRIAKCFDCLKCNVYFSQA